MASEFRILCVLDIDKYFVNNCIKPVVNLYINVNIKNSFDVLGHDLDLAGLNMECTDLMEHNRLKVLRQMSLSILVHLFGTNKLKNIIVLLARVMAANPYTQCGRRKI